MENQHVYILVELQEGINIGKLITPEVYRNYDEAKQALIDNFQDVHDSLEEQTLNQDILKPDHTFAILSTNNTIWRWEIHEDNIK